MNKPTKQIDPAEYAKVGTEHAHQTALFIWASQNFDKYPVLKLMYAIPNGGERNLKVAANLKAEGVKAGVPDVFLPVARGVWHGLYIEMKRPKGQDKQKGRVEYVQTEFHKGLREQGYGIGVCYSWEEARDCIVQYLDWQHYVVDTDERKD